MQFSFIAFWNHNAIGSREFDENINLMLSILPIWSWPPSFWFITLHILGALCWPLFTKDSGCKRQTPSSSGWPLLFHWWDALTWCGWIYLFIFNFDCIFAQTCCFSLCGIFLNLFLSSPGSGIMDKCSGDPQPVILTWKCWIHPEITLSLLQTWKSQLLIFFFLHIVSQICIFA